MKINAKGTTTCKAGEFKFGDTFVFDGDVYMVVDTSVYYEELGENDDTVYIVRLRDGFMDGVSLNCQVSRINMVATIENEIIEEEDY